MEAFSIGTCGIDTEKASRQYSVKYALNTPRGVRALLRDYNRLYARKYDKADYAAADILIDLQTAITASKLTRRQAEVIALIFVDDLTQETAGERLGVDRTAVTHALTGAIKRITRVYRDWEYGEVSVVLDGENEGETDE